MKTNTQYKVGFTNCLVTLKNVIIQDDEFVAELQYDDNSKGIKYFDLKDFCNAAVQVNQDFEIVVSSVESNYTVGRLGGCGDYGNRDDIGLDGTVTVHCAINGIELDFYFQSEERTNGMRNYDGGAFFYAGIMQMSDDEFQKKLGLKPIDDAFDDIWQAAKKHGDEELRQQILLT